ncbi:saccharopine dehydrogenase NADP-binding domain-containing protein [soil metagenome]
MSTQPRIVLIGATGYTGTLVAGELAGGASPFVLTGRDSSKLGRLARDLGVAETRVVDVTNRGSLRRALRPGDVVINCAGPFTDLGEAVVAACIESGTHYVDTTGEQRFMKRIFDHYDRAARDAGVVVANAMAFEYAIGDCAVAVAAEGLATPLPSVDVTYAWQGGAAASSRGTRRSMLRVLREGGYMYRGGEWRTQAVGAQRRTVRLPDGTSRAALSFPAGETLSVPRHLEVEEVRGWIVAGRYAAAVMPLVSGVLPSLVRLSSPVTERVLRGAPDGPPEEARKASRFTIQVEAAGADGARRAVSVRGQDPYGLTAIIAVHGAMRVLESAGTRSGVLTPAQLLEPAAFLEMLAPYGLTWNEHSPRAA